MSQDTFRQSSRLDWLPTQSGGPSDTQIACGALQRIADATEVMAKNHAALIAERDRYERWYKEAKAGAERLARSNSALRGTITRLKAQMRPPEVAP